MVLESAGAMRVAEQAMERLGLGQVYKVTIGFGGMIDVFATGTDRVSHTVSRLASLCSQSDFLAVDSQPSQYA